MSTPTNPRKDFGRFSGRIWIETKGGNVVRFNGDFAGSILTMKEFYHFDSWRTNIQPDLWLPTSFYVEESDPKSTTSTLKFKAINYIWGYALKVPDSNAENTSLSAAGAADVSNDAPITAPSPRNVSGSSRPRTTSSHASIRPACSTPPASSTKPSPPSPKYPRLQQHSDHPPHPCAHPAHRTPRVTFRRQHHHPLQGTLDTTSVPTSDGAQQIGNLNALLAFQLAHVILGHRLDTKYAFNDRLLFPSASVFERIPMHHTAADNTEAARKRCNSSASRNSPTGKSTSASICNNSSKNQGPARTQSAHHRRRPRQQRYR